MLSVFFFVSAGLCNCNKYIDGVMTPRSIKAKVHYTLSAFILQH